MTEQRTEAWLRARAGRVTGSITGAILNHSPYMTREEAMRSMVRAYHGAGSEFKGGPHIDYGVANEATAIGMFELESSLDVEKCGFFEYEDWAGASPDGLVGENAVIEVKCPWGLRNGGEFKSILSGELPHYYDQCQMQLLATGRDTCYFHQWAPHDTKTEIVSVDHEWRDTNLPKLKQFYAEFLSELDNPSHLEPARIEVNTAASKRLLDEYDQLKDAIDQAEERRKEVLEELVTLAKGRDAEVWGRKLTSVQRAGTTNYKKALADLLPNADLSAYVGKEPKPYWKLN